jgi:23S rRNA pseudouridine1911/1915/1917 synthase
VGGGGELETGPIELTAAADDAGLRLDAFLAARAAFPSRAAAQRAIDAGDVTVDGAVQPKNHRVDEGERIQVLAVPDAEAAPASAAITFETV